MQLLKDLAIGAVIGAANIIPGVSGGTMALILGVYERLLAIISSISGHSIKRLLGILRFNEKGVSEFKQEFDRLEGYFLIKLGIGALLAIVSLASIMTYLLKEFHDPTYGFFFGLVAISAVYPYKLIKKHRPFIFLMVVLGGLSVLGLTNSVSNEDLLDRAKLKQDIKAMKKQGVKPSNQSIATDRPALTFVFILGAISITAMVLPGISGSFLLLLLGGYFDLLRAIALRDLVMLGVFSLGCLIGLILSTRIIQKLLDKWHDATMGFLLGLVLGSLWMIWPFKQNQKIGSEVVYLDNMIPSQWGNNELITLLSLAVGAALVGIFLLYEASKKRIA